MVSQKHTTRVAPHISSAASLSTSTSTHHSNASVIHKAAFAPSAFQLSLFASVIQGLNGHQVRIHDTVSGQLQCQHDTHAASITSLDWGFYGDADHLLEPKTSKKKRKRLEEANGIKPPSGDVVLALGTNHSEIQFFSPANAKVIATLKSGHKSGVKAFKFTNYGLEGTGWSIGADKKLVQWNLRDQTVLRTVEHPVSPPSALLPFSSAVLIASHDTWLVDPDADHAPSQIGSGASPVHTICANLTPGAEGKPEQVLTAAQDERQILVYDVSGKHTSVLTLNATGDVEILAMPQAPRESNDSRRAGQPRPLAAITKRGELELFADPFQSTQLANGDSGRKSRLKNRTRRSKATVTIAYNGAKQDPLPLVGASFHDDDLVLAYVEHGGHIAFERMQWLDSETNELLIDGTLVVQKEKTIVGVENTHRVGAKLVGRSQVDESHAVVSYGRDDDPEAMAVDEAEPITISSGEEEESDSDDEEGLPNGIDTAMQDAREAESGESDDDLADGSQSGIDVEPTFGDLLQSNAPRTIDVTSQSQDHPAQSVVPYGQDTSKAPSGLTLTNVLSQALRTSDVNLLESCFHEQDLNVVRATIERLDSSLATVLLQRLAEKLHSRPGRAGSLMIWIQWTLVSHGGFLGSQPDSIKKLAALQQVVKERANSLQPLLSLKGKLDMLEAQMNLRRSVLSRARRQSPIVDEEDASVVYVEGQDDSDAAATSSEDKSDEGDDEEGDDLELDLASEGSDEDDSDTSNVEGAGLIEEEASEAESSEQEIYEEVDYEDVDSVDDMSEEEGAAFSGKSKLPNGIR